MFDERLSKEYWETHKAFDPCEMEYEDGERAYPHRPGMHRHSGANYWHDKRRIHREGSDGDFVHRLMGFGYKGKQSRFPAKPKEKDTGDSQ